jgi:hypothetical protein
LNKSIIALAFAATVALGSTAYAAPVMVDGGNQDIAGADLQCQVGIFNEEDIQDLVAASSVTVYHLPDVLDFDEYEAVCSAVDSSGAVPRLREAIKANAEAAQWFSDNGLDPNSAVLIVDNTDDTVDLYLQ